MARRVAVVHPDLGIGGAERLIVDASKALQDYGNFVDIYTAYHDKSRCFKETADGTLRVHTVGQWIPRSIFGRFHALFAYIKMIYMAIYLLIFENFYDIILCDQVPASIPIIRLRNLLSRNKSRVIFYCHFPDQLLTSRESLLKRLYRLPLDYFEEWSTGLADVILVNSEFTKGVVERTFKSLKDRNLEVLYPSVDVASFIRHRPSAKDCEVFKRRYEKLRNARFTLLSINRFERKKDLGYAILEFSRLKKNLKAFDECQLIIAGGYDERLHDCVNYYNDLVNLVNSLELTQNVTFIKSPSDEDKLILLELSDALIYTPENEHFGIVPIEAMAMRKPVIARASGGPLETISHEYNGFLCDSDNDDRWFEAWKAMRKLATKPELGKTMGEDGFIRVKQKFSYEVFSNKLNDICSFQIADTQR